MIVRILIAAILAGLVAGVFYTAAQAVKVSPLILKAETFENAGAAAATPENHPHSAEELKNPDHGHEATAPVADEGESWAPNDGIERTFYSMISNSILGVSNALLLVAAILFSKTSISVRTGIAWGAAGFVVFVLAPSIGLPPELPGTKAASVFDRQVWWTATVALTAAGLALMAFKTKWYWMALGVVLMVVPHVYGAPQPEVHGSLAPAYLVAEFVVAATVTAGLFWLATGAALGWFLPRALAPSAKDAS